MPDTLGRVGPSRTNVVAPSPQAGPASFGAGVARAISTMASGMADFETSQEAIATSEQQLSRAYQARSNRSTRANAAVSIIRAQTALTQDIEELRRSMPVDGSGFTDAVNERVQAAIGQLRGSIPEALQPEFAQRLATLEASMTTAAFETELAAGDAAYTNDVSGLLEQAINEITLETGTVENWREDLSEILDTSPLAPEQTEALREQVMNTLDIMEFDQEVRRVVDNPALDTGSLPGTPSGDDIAATGMSGQARGMLNSGVIFAHERSGTTVNVSPSTGTPDVRLLNILGTTATQVFGEGATIEIFSGHEGRSTGTRRHPAGLAADFVVILPDGTELRSAHPLFREFTHQAARNGIRGMGHSAHSYMGDGRFHMDIMEPEDAGGGHLWAEIANDAELLRIMQEYQGQPTATNYGEGTEYPGETSGRYAIEPDAWEHASTELGLNDFSPANQDRAAWWLAGQTYRVVTGRNLQADLASQDPVIIEAARQTIIQNAQGYSLPGLAETSAEDFYDSVTLSRGTPPSVIFDDRFASIPAAERIERFNVTQAQQLEALMSRENSANAARSEFLTQLEAQISLGVAGQEEIRIANEQYGLRPTELLDLTQALDRQQEQATQNASFAARLSSPGTFFFDEGRVGERDAANQYSAQAHTGAIEERDIDAFNAQAGRDIELMNYVPEPVVDQLTRLARSSTPSDTDFAYSAMASIYNRNPVLFERTFGDQQTRAMRFYTIAGSYLPAEERMARIQQMLTPFGAELEAQTTTALNAIRRGNPQWFSSGGIAAEIDIGRGEALIASPLMARSLEVEFGELFREELRLGQTPEDARAAVLDTLRTRWGETQFGHEDGYVMRRPPERYYMPGIDGTHSWINDIIIQELEIDPSTSYRLISDHITEADIQRGQQPSYAISVAQDGLMLPHMQDTGLPSRIRFDNVEVQERLIQDVVSQQEQVMQDYSLTASATTLAQMTTDDPDYQQTVESVAQQLTTRYQRDDELREDPQAITQFLIQYGIVDFEMRMDVMEAMRQ